MNGLGSPGWVAFGNTPNDNQKQPLPVPPAKAADAAHHPLRSTDTYQRTRPDAQPQPQQSNHAATGPKNQPSKADNAPESMSSAQKQSDKQKKNQRKNRVGFFFSFLHTGIALTMAPVFFLSTLMGARGLAMREAEKLAAKKTGKAFSGVLKQGFHPGKWFQGVLRNATEATIVEEKSKSWVRKPVNAIFKKFSNRDLNDNDIKGMYKWSKILLTATVFPKALNGIVYGVTAQQPSMIFEHAIEMLAFPFALAQTPLIQNALFMVSGLFSLGLANDLDNDKKRAKGASDLRIYDMSRLKKSLNLHSELNPAERAKNLFADAKGMTRFVGEDMKVGLGRVKRDVSLAAHKQPNEMLDASGNGGKASLNFALLQLGTIPKLMLSFMRNDNGPLGQAIKVYSGIMQSLAVVVGDFTIFMLGKNGETLGERLPMVGVSTEAAGRIISYGKAEKPLATFLQKIGEAGNSIFYSVRSAKLEQ